MSEGCEFVVLCGYGHTSGTSPTLTRSEPPTGRDTRGLTKRSEASARYELGMAPSPEALADAARELLLANLTDSAGELARTVWTCTYPAALDDAAIEVLVNGPANTHLVYVRAQDKLVQYGAKVWGYDPRDCAQLASRLDRLCDRLGPERSSVVELSDAEVFATVEQDGVTDAAIAAAIAVLEHFSIHPSRWKAYLSSVAPSVGSRG